MTTFLHHHLDRTHQYAYRRFAASLAIVVSGVIATNMFADVATYSIEALPALGPSLSFEPSSINKSGTIFGETLNSVGASSATIYQNGTAGSLLPGEHMLLSRVAGNDAGQAVGYFVDADTGFGQYSAGFLSNANGTTLFVNQGQATFVPLAINNLGIAVGQIASGDAGIYSSTTGVLADLGTFGGVSARLTAVNDVGQLAGDISMTINNTIVRAMIVTNGQAEILPSLAGIDDAANAINSEGWVIGQSASADGLANAVLWKDGNLIQLNPLNSGDQPDPVAINDAGEIVGDSGDSPVLWNSTGQAINLNTLLPNDSGWVLYEADGINDAGQIVGVGRYNGQEEAFLLTPMGDISIPEPAAIPLATVFCLLVSRRQRGGISQ